MKIDTYLHKGESYAYASHNKHIVLYPLLKAINTTLECKHNQYIRITDINIDYSEHSIQFNIKHSFPKVVIYCVPDYNLYLRFFGGFVTAWDQGNIARGS